MSNIFPPTPTYFPYAVEKDVDVM